MIKINYSDNEIWTKNDIKYSINYGVGRYLDCYKKIEFENSEKFYGYRVEKINDKFFATFYSVRNYGVTNWYTEKYDRLKIDDLFFNVISILAINKQTELIKFLEYVNGKKLLIIDGEDVIEIANKYKGINCGYYKDNEEIQSNLLFDLRENVRTGKKDIYLDLDMLESALINNYADSRKTKKVLTKGIINSIMNESRDKREKKEA